MSRGIWVRTPEFRRKLSQIHKGKKMSPTACRNNSLAKMGKLNPHYGKPNSELTREKLSKNHMGHIVTKETRDKIAKGLKGKHPTDKTRMKMCLNNPDRHGSKHPLWGKHHTTETKAKISQSRKGIKHSETAKQKISKTLKLLLQDPEYIAKMIKAHAARPTKPESVLKAILDKHFLDFKYNGDYRLGVTLGGMIPDFVNVNGEKEVIEVFGNYWHSGERIKNRWQGSELGKIMAYNSIGYRCLVLWGSELKKLSEDEIVQKISNFTDLRRMKHTI